MSECICGSVVDMWDAHSAESEYDVKLTLWLWLDGKWMLSLTLAVCVLELFRLNIMLSK